MAPRKYSCIFVQSHTLVVFLSLTLLLAWLRSDTIPRKVSHGFQYTACHGESHLQVGSRPFFAISEPVTSAVTASVDAFDYYDLNNFKQSLRADCHYYDERNGLFEPDTPYPRYIITGGAGFIGSHIVKALRAEGVRPSQLKVIDNLWRGRLANLQYSDGTWAVNATADFCALDLRNKEDTLKYIRGADYVYHLAGILPSARTSTPNSTPEVQESLFYDNILIDTHTLKAAKDNGIPNYIYAGKGQKEDIHDKNDMPVLNQTYPRTSKSVYEWSKTVGEYETQLASDSGFFNVGLLYFQNVYGPSSHDTSSQAIPVLIQKALNYPNEPYIVSGLGNQGYDFVYIDDVVRALILTRDRGMNMGVIQLRSPRAITYHELAVDIADLVGKRNNKDIEIVSDQCDPTSDRSSSTAVDKRAEHILGWKPQTSLREGLKNILDWRQEYPSQPSVLVIVIGQARGSEYAWKSLFQHLIKPYRAHLATYFTDSSPQTPLQQNAQFTWSIAEPEDWGIYFDKASQLCKTEAERQEGWRSFCDIKDQWLGGLKSCNQPGSAGILLAFRWLVAQKILSLNLLKQYDYFVMTRADFVYLCDHLPFANLDSKVGYVPAGEGYGGYTDRHLVGSAKTFFKMVNITQQMLCDVSHYKQVQNQSHPTLNLEQTQRNMWTDLDIPINKFNRSFFSVKLPEDPTTWSIGSQNAVLTEFSGLSVKYEGELKQSLEKCEVDLRTKMLAIEGLGY